MRLQAAHFALRHPFLRRPVPISGSERIALFVSLIDTPVQVKIEGMFAKRLQLEGLTPVVLTHRACKNAQRLFRAFGITRFFFLDDLLKDADASDIPALTERILREATTFGAFLGVTEGGIRIGNHVLSTVVRRTKGGSGTFQDPAVRELLGQLLPRSLHTARAAELLFERVRPEAVFFLEKGYSPYGEFFDAAIQRGLPCIQFVHSQKSDALILKRYGRENATTHPFSLAPATWERVKAMRWSPEDERAFRDELRRSYAEGTWFNRKFLLDGKKMKSPEEIRGQLKLDPQKKTAVIFSHVLWDATFFFGKTLFSDYEEWLVETVRAACANTAVNWIVKLHPDYAWKMKQMGDRGDPRDIIALQANIGTLPPHVQVVKPDIDISTYSFFAVTDYAITVRGTIGIEAPCFGIPVFTAGTGRYSGLGFTEDFRTREDYLAAMARIQQYPPLSPERTALALRHAHALFDLRPLPFSSFTFVRGTGTTRDDLAIRVRDLEKLRSAHDLTAFADWVLRSREEDFIRLPA